MPQISFIIPVLNEEDFIGRCLQSIKALDFDQKEIEVIIIDNGSTDGTRKVIESLGYKFIVKQDMNVSGLRNLGAQIARGEFLAFVDADMELTPTWLTNGLKSFLEKGVVAAGCPPQAPTNATWVQKTWELHRCRNLTQLSRPVSWLSSMNLIVRRSEFVSVSGFNEGLETAEDVDLCYRLGEKGFILQNSTMVAIHWGEAKNLQMFWQKEVWRGKGNVPGLFSHGLRVDEVKSLGYPLFVIAVMVFLVYGFCVDVFTQSVFFIPISSFLLCLPPFLLALHTEISSHRPLSIPNLFVVYLVYGLARGWSIVVSLPSLIFPKRCDG